MKYFILIAALALSGYSTWAQEKQDAKIKIIMVENGKQKVIERHFKDFNQADIELKKINDSLDLDIKTLGDKKKTIRLDVNKHEGKVVRIEKDDNLFLQGSDEEQDPREVKRIMIIRRGDKEGFTISENTHGPEAFKYELGGLDKQSKQFAKWHKGILEDVSKTIQGLMVTPNKPFNGKISVSFNAPDKGNVSISVLDVNGKELANEQIKDFQGEYLGQIDIKKAGNGVYFIRVSQGADGAVRRIKVD